MKFAKYSISVILLFVIGFYLYSDFFTYSISRLEAGNLSLQSRTLSGNFYRSLLFPIVLGILPLLYLLVRKVTEVKFLYKGLMTCGIIVGFGILFWRLRIFGLNSEFEQLSAYNLPEGLKPTIELGYLKFEVYVLIGFIVGTLVSILVFRDRSKSLLN